MASIVQPDNAIIDYTTIQSIIKAVEELQSAATATGSSAAQKTVKNLQWVSKDKSSITLDFSKSGFTSAPVVVVSIVDNDQDKSKVIPPYAYIYGKPTQNAAVVKFSKDLPAGIWVSWIAVGTVAS